MPCEETFPGLFAYVLLREERQDTRFGILVGLIWWAYGVGQTEGEREGGREVEESSNFANSI